MGLYLVVSAFATFIAGRLADRMDARALLGGGILLGGIGTGLMSLVSAPWHAMLLYGVVFAIGNGAASLTTVGVMVTRSAPERAGLANAAVISGTSAGQLVMIAALAAVLVEIGWRAVFACLAAAHLLLLLLLAPTLAGAKPLDAASAQRSGLDLPPPHARRASGCCSPCTPSAAWTISSSPRTSWPSPRTAASVRCSRATCSR